MEEPGVAAIYGQLAHSRTPTKANLAATADDKEANENVQGGCWNVVFGEG